MACLNSPVLFCAASCAKDKTEKPLPDRTRQGLKIRAILGWWWI
jgi:hypothetical protein